MKHTTPKRITLSEAIDRIEDLTDVRLAEESGVDRTWIGRLKDRADANVSIDTYEKLDGALRRLGGLKRGEKLVFGAAAEAAAR